MKTIMLLGVLFFMFLSSEVLADIVYLQNGNSYEGQIIKEDDEKVALKTSIMTIVLEKKYIRAIQREYPSVDSRLSAGDKFDISEVLKKSQPNAEIKIFNKEDFKGE